MEDTIKRQRENIELVYNNKLSKSIQIITEDKSKTEREKKELASEKIFNFTFDYFSKNNDLTKIKDIISEIVKNNPDLTSFAIFGFILGCISEKVELKDIQGIISEIINENSKLAYNIVDGFTLACISKGKGTEEIGGAISGIVQKNPDLTDNIVNGFTQSYIASGKKLDKIGGAISGMIKDNPNLTHKIIAGFTQGYFSGGKNLTLIKDKILEIIQTDGIKDNPSLVLNIIYYFTQSCIINNKSSTQISNKISEIIQTDGIKDNPDLVFNIINGFVKGCLTREPNNKKINIKDIMENFFNLLSRTEDKIKDKLKPIFSLIVSQYFMNTLTNSGNEQLSEEDKKQTETKLFECYQELFHKEDKEKIASFKDIPLKELLKLQDEYLKGKFKEKGVNAGLKYETFLKMACNLMLKSEGNRKLIVEDLEKQKEIFKDLKFIDLDIANSIKSKKELFEKIGLEPKDFGTDKKGSDFSVVYCSYLNHAFVMIVDKTKKWDEAIDKDIESIYLIDSSRYIEYEEAKKNKKEQIFKTTKTLNQHYQKNGTCWLNAMSAVGFLLEKQQERIAEQRQEQQEQTEQQPRKPYGLSINELLEGFDKKRDNESKKIIESATPQEKPSSFEQGICDYSTEHFYTLTVSDEEKGIIKEFLAEQVEQNKINKKKILKMFNRLNKLLFRRNKEDEKELDLSEEKSEKKFVIKYDYLKESLKRFTQDAEKLKELCAKLGIDNVQLLKTKQKEDSSNKKRKYGLFSGCMSGDIIGERPIDINFSCNIKDMIVDYATL